MPLRTGGSSSVPVEATGLLGVGLGLESEAGFECESVMVNVVVVGLEPNDRHERGDAMATEWPI